MTNPPTLSEMRHSLGEVAPDVEVDVQPPTLSEMAQMMPIENEDFVLMHFGIKGMKWGVRRTDKQLAAVRNADGEEVGGIRAKSRAAANKLKSMKTGEVMVFDTADDGPKVLVKQKDGTFKEAVISADAQNVMRTMSKDPSEMSTREMNDAIKRAKAIEDYNKLFNPMADPNAELKARVDAMELQAKYAKAYAQMNPSKSAKVANFIGDLQPAFKAFKTADDALNGALNDNIDRVIKRMRGLDEDGNPVASTPKAEPRSNKGYGPKPSKKKAKDDDIVYNITTLPGEVGRRR